MAENNFFFFLGGHDGEMMAIKDLLDKNKIPYEDGAIAWNQASTDVYGDKIKKAAEDGYTPVTIELAIKDNVPANLIAVDHHNERAGEKASILQVYDLLGEKPDRMAQLIAANDAEYIPGMLAMGATKEEINKIRYRDRHAQGITEEQEKQAEKALRESVNIDGVTVIYSPHSRCAPYTDKLFDANTPQNILIVSEPDKEIDYFGAGDICQALKEKKLGKEGDQYDKWSGGSDLYGPYFGMSWSKEGGKVDVQAVVDTVIELNRAKNTQARVLSAMKNNAKQNG